MKVYLTNPEKPKNNVNPITAGGIMGSVNSPMANISSAYNSGAVAEPAKQQDSDETEENNSQRTFPINSREEMENGMGDEEFVRTIHTKIKENIIAPDYGAILIVARIVKIVFSMSNPTITYANSTINNYIINMLEDLLTKHLTFVKEESNFDNDTLDVINMFIDEFCDINLVLVTHSKRINEFKKKIYDFF